MHLNNKGQTLVIFIILIPILILISILVIDIGNITTYYQEEKNITKLVLDYGLDNYNDPNVVSNMYELAKLNNNKIKFTINYTDQEFKIETNYYTKGILNRKGYHLKNNYKAYLDGKKHIIKKIK